MKNQHDTAPLVANASDVKQVRNARRSERDRIEAEAEEMRAVLGTVAGRRVFWRLLGSCGYGRSLGNVPHSEREFMAGRQDTMWMILALCTEAVPGVLHTMATEAAEQVKREALAAVAVRTPGANDEPDETA